MKTKLEITFYSDANTNLISDLSLIVAKHNSGKSIVELSIIEGYFKGYCARYDYPEAITYLDEYNGTLALYMKKEEPFLLITEKQYIGELTASEADLINQENLS